MYRQRYSDILNIFQNTAKPVIFIQAMLHGREWLTLPTVMYAIEKLVTNVTETDLVEDIDWIIAPILNPDGYEWTHTNVSIFL
jgi:murein tripeptide amidase MpaA